MDTPLITIADCRKFRQISKQINTDSFDGHVRSVQQNELRNLLGKSLYLDFMTNLTDAKYLTLLNGGNYVLNGKTIKFYGLKPFIIFNFFASYLTDSTLKMADVGNVTLQGNFFNVATPSEVSKARQEFMQNVQMYENDVVEFLNANRSTYDLWEIAKGDDIISYDFNII